jgi:hypothetical protein
MLEYSTLPASEAATECSEAEAQWRTYLPVVVCRQLQFKPRTKQSTTSSSCHEQSPALTGRPRRLLHRIECPHLTLASRTGSGTYSGMPNEDAAAPSFLPVAGRHTGACGRSRGALMLRCGLLLPLLPLLAAPAVDCGRSAWKACASGVKGRDTLAAEMKGLRPTGLQDFRSSCTVTKS